MTGPLLRPRDVAKLLLVSEQTVRNLAFVGEIAGVYFHARNGKGEKNRKTLRFTAQAVSDFIRRNTVEGKTGR